jgi:hypothetical protein
MSFNDQLNRIQLKLNQAKKKDFAREVFGADAHQYESGSPVSTEEVIRFEEHHNIDLPEEYKAFITTLGNGGPGNYGGAGPYYGLYELGDFGYMEPSAKYMSAPCIINSSLTEKKWKVLTAFEEKLDSDSLEYDRKYQLLFSGLMFIGTMGDSGQMMLILNGIDCGRVVYVNQDLYQPMMKGKFLDWYEEWLDNILQK